MHFDDAMRSFDVLTDLKFIVRHNYWLQSVLFG